MACIVRFVAKTVNRVNGKLFYALFNTFAIMFDGLYARQELGAKKYIFY